VPPPTLERFMLDDHLVRVVVGPVGSGKSMGCIMELMRRACQQAPATGTRTRYTRFALIRNTLPQLRQTVLADVQNYLRGVITYFTTDHVVKVRGNLPDGTELHSDWLLLPLDTKDDVQRLLSLQLTGAWVNEVREVPIEVLSALLGRLGRFPSKVQGGPTWFGLICDTNPWDEDSPYHERLVLKPDKNWALFHQPDGTGPDAENVENLPPGYYENLAGDRDLEWVNVHVHSQFGTSNAGQAVFRRSFHAPTHCRDMKVIVNAYRPLLVGMDFGRTPCALIAQEDGYGRLLVFEEIITEDMGLLQMVQERLRPALSKEPYAGKRVIVVGDPAGTQKSQVSEESPFTVLRGEGFAAYPANTNEIQPRLLAVERVLRQQIVGEPGLQINRGGCPTLITSLGNRYRYRKRKDGQLEDKPEKLHPWSDICDALQYLCLGAQMNLAARVVRRDTRRAAALDRPRVSAAGWT
jgi:hypothetical protein